MINRLLIIAHFGHFRGYTKVANEIARRLLRKDWNLWLQAAEPCNIELIPQELRLFFNKPNPPSHSLVITTPDNWCNFELNKKTIYLTMNEATTLPEHWVKNLNRTALVIVPNKWNQTHFSKDGVTVPIHVVPLGYEPSIFFPTNTFPELCTFGAAGAMLGGGFRKNLPQIIEIFQEVFPTQIDVRLHIKISPACDLLNPNDSRIIINRNIISEREMAKWYQSLTVFINFSYAEGFGLHLVEAMACGRAVISTKYSGPAEYFTEEIGYKLNFDEIDITGVPYYKGRWAKPNNIDLAVIMREIYRNSLQAKIVGEKAATHILSFKWENCINQLDWILHQFCQQ